MLINNTWQSQKERIIKEQFDKLEKRQAFKSFLSLELSLPGNKRCEGLVPNAIVAWFIP